jgi:O-antigen/teichoic acid export membrane protein
LQKYLGRWLTILGLVITVIFCVFSPLLSGFLHISSWWSVCIFGLVFLVTFNTSVYRGALQGLQRFGKLAGSLITESGIKLVVGAGLALLGFAVIGGITGIVIGVVAGFATAWGFSHYSRTSPGRPPKDIRAIIAYALPVTIVLLTTTLLYSIDVVLVKHYFSSTEAGYYAALSQLGKIIVFGTMAISGVMFPMVAEKLEKKENYRIVFWKACGIVSGLSLLAVITYFVAPGFVIHLLYGPEYLAGASLLGYIAIFMALYSIINVFVQFFLSLKSYGALWPLVIGCIAQICLLASWHSTLKQVILIIDWCLAAILGALFIYYVYQSHRLKISGKAFHSGPGV